MNAPARPQRLEMTLKDRLEQAEGWVYMTGMQALVRLPIDQRRRDQAAGLNTGGYISGYRGSPMGTYDMALWQADAVLKAHNIHFQPGVNEDLAATATWGAQMVGLFPGARVEGVFSIWYGKAPGLDRSMDAIRHANLAGTNPKGGTLLLVGDDHGAKSSTLACSSDLNFAALGLPLLAPANAQDVLDYGLHGIAMSRHSSAIVGMKLVTDVVEGGGSVHVGPDSPAITTPPGGGTDAAIRPFTPIPEQERLLWNVRLARALDYARANGLNRADGPADARIGVVAAGKAWQDLAQALAGMGAALPLRRLKLGLIWPLDGAAIRDFARGLDLLIVVEEKRPLIEDQIRAALYDAQTRPRIIGKTWDGAETAFPNHGEITPGLVAQVITRAAAQMTPPVILPAPNRPAAPQPPGIGALRAPTFCAGCPHGRSTQLPDGSRALAGIGCHTMAMFRDPAHTNSVSHMGGEGAMWLGQFPFTDEAHVFANMGDGTYFHSGLLAIRAAVAAGATMTYKLLHNGFVSMTGGQPHDGDITPQRMIAQLLAEGVSRIALVADDPARYRGAALGAGVTLHPRTEMDQVQRDLRRVAGVSVIVYDQPCATERRRLRKRGKWPDPDTRVFINPEVCEGCGDCSTISACMAIEPLETPLGRKRQINQSSCNKDFSCVEGFCPAFVTLSGVRPHRAAAPDVAIDVGHLPMPALPPVDGSWAILVSGIGGAGVVTLGQTLAVAAHADGYFASNLDITGLAQKYGAVHSHIKIAATPGDMRATRIAGAEADALIGCDLVVAAGDEALTRMAPGHSVAVTDTTIVPTAEFSANPDWRLDAAGQLGRMRAVLGHGLHALDAQGLAQAVMGDRVFANMVLMGAAWQQGGIPLTLAAIHHAIALNGVAVDANRKAFDLGRLAVADAGAVARLVPGAAPGAGAAPAPDTAAALVADRAARLRDYGGARMARRYRRRMAALARAGLDEAAQMAAARGLFKLMAVKDEYEVARLYTRPAFLRGVNAAFDATQGGAVGADRLTFHVGAWPYGGRDARTGRLVKGAVRGGTAMRAFGVLNRLRFLRGTPLNPFGYHAEARMARRLLAAYHADLDLAAAQWSAARAAQITALLALPDAIRGYGPVREAHAERAADTAARLRRAITAPEVAPKAA